MKKILRLTFILILTATPSAQADCTKRSEGFSTIITCDKNAKGTNKINSGAVLTPTSSMTEAINKKFNVTPKNVSRKQNTNIIEEISHTNVKKLTKPLFYNQ